ncbi:PBECR3 domain-containing polyvalent protein, partial [Helicobacter bizzozeronii]
LGDSGGKSPKEESSPSSAGGKEGDGGKSGNGSGDGAGGNPPSSDDLLDPSKPLRKARPEEITQELLERVKETNAKIWVGDLTNPQILEHLGMDTQTPMMFIADGNALTHIEKRHGLNAPLVKSSGQPAITHEDIANYPDIVNHADLMKIEKYNDLTTIIIGKQINGYIVVVEVVGKKNNRLALKTMYKERGKLEQGLDFRDGNYIRLSQR